MTVELNGSMPIWLKFAGIKDDSDYSEKRLTEFVKDIVDFDKYSLKVEGKGHNEIYVFIRDVGETNYVLSSFVLNTFPGNCCPLIMHSCDEDIRMEYNLPFAIAKLLATIGKFGGLIYTTSSTQINLNEFLKNSKDWKLQETSAMKNPKTSHVSRIWVNSIPS